jgi:hypothetical protein
MRERHKLIKLVIKKGSLIFLNKKEIQGITRYYTENLYSNKVENLEGMINF